MSSRLRRAVRSFLMLPLAVAAGATVSAAADVSVEGLRTEYKEDPLGIDAREPRLSWQITSTARGVAQAAYRVRVAGSEADVQAGRDLVWDSGRVASDASVHVPYAGPALGSGQRYHWQVRIWDGAGDASDWSAPAFWEMGLLEPSDWQASWIEPGLDEDVTQTGPAPMLRRDFALDGEVRSARAYVTSHGLYELYLNGQRVGEDLFTPGWTSYDTRLQYQTYDVTDLLKSGDNAVGAVLGNGWYRGYLAWREQRNIYGDHLALLLQIRVTYADGREEVVGSDGDWKAAYGPIRMSEIYHGETYDARLEQDGWTTAGFDDGAWSAVRVADHGTDRLIAPAGPPVRRIDELEPVKIFQTPEGDTVADLGQNLVGWVRLKVDGPEGTTVTIRHAEVLDKDGNFYTENLRAAKATMSYTLAGGGPEVFEPHFTFFGFRYVAVDGYPGDLTPDAIMGISVHSDMDVTGSLETSKPLVNQLQQNIVWGQKGNFLDVPTDCPQRDERLGWTGDAQAFFSTAAYNMDVAGFFTKWLADVEADQLENGAVPHVVPNVLPPGDDGDPAGATGWADAAVIIPWQMYVRYGDERILEQQYDSMVRWVSFMEERAGDDYVWEGDTHYGDWLAYTAPPDVARFYPGAYTNTDYIATAFFAHSTDLLRRTAEVLGKTDDAARYAAQAEKIEAALLHEFVTPSGRVSEGTQTAYVLALHFDLLPEELRETSARLLAEEVRRRGHLTTGFLGTPYLCHVLSRYGYLDEAYMLLNREEYPSWLYPVTQDATTIWERWDGQKPDGSFQDAGMNSFNHYAYGAIGDWMYRVMAGIELDASAPGYKHVFIQPRPGGGFDRVAASHDSLYGTVSSSWRIEDGTFHLDVEVPANTTATVRLSGASVSGTTEGGEALTEGDGIGSVRQDGDDVVVEIGSGRYSFAHAASMGG